MPTKYDWNNPNIYKRTWIIDEDLTNVDFKIPDSVEPDSQTSMIITTSKESSILFCWHPHKLCAIHSFKSPVHPFSRRQQQNKDQSQESYESITWEKKDQMSASSEETQIDQVISPTKLDWNRYEVSEKCSCLAKENLLTSIPSIYPSHYVALDLYLQLVWLGWRGGPLITGSVAEFVAVWRCEVI